MIKDEILDLLNSVKREGIEELIEYLKVSDFFTAPASTKFHGNYRGALGEHSLNVTKLFIEKNERYNLGLSMETCIICGLMHDLCKVGVYTMEEQWRINATQPKKPDGSKNWEKYVAYKSNDTLPLGHGEKSVMLLKDFIKVTPEEALLIRWHMGGFVSKDDLYHFDKAVKIVPAIVALHTADFEATIFLEKTVEV